MFWPGFVDEAFLKTIFENLYLFLRYFIWDSVPGFNGSVQWACCIFAGAVDGEV